MNKATDPSLATELAGVTPAEKVATLFAYMEKKGQTFYDEVVTQLEHALQCTRNLDGARHDVRLASKLCSHLSKAPHWAV